jgi:hypothetical protein
MKKLMPLLLKYLLLGLALVALFTAISYAWARYNRPLFVWDKYTPPLLVWDMPNVRGFPKQFRTTSDPVSKKINTQGLAELHAMASAQFSELELQSILQRFGTQHITVIDLRQESHGFLNGSAISWYGVHNAANQGKTPEEIERSQEKFLTNLQQNAWANISEIVDKSSGGTIRRYKPFFYIVQSVKSEANLVSEYQLNYQRFYVQDFHRPDDSQVDRFIQMVKQMPPYEWLYFHCRAGVGRSTTFMVMYDMMNNAKRVSFDDILARQHAIGGQELSEMPESNNYKYRYAIERLNFLKDFYKYARKSNFEISWSDWYYQHFSSP